MIFYDLGALTKSNEVKINGYVIGKVYELESTDPNVNGIVATINLSENVNIPDNSTAFISSPIIGASYIVIEKGNSKRYLEAGDTLNTRKDSGIFDDVKAQINPTLTTVREGIDSLKMLISNVNTLFNPETKAHLNHILANLAVTTGSLNRLMDPQNGALARSLNNMEAITQNLKNNNDSINATISNAKRASAKFADLELQPVIDSLGVAVTQLKSVIAKIDSKDGTLGALINDKQVYNKLHDAILSAEILMDDLRAHPKRYVNISVFGKKDKDGYLTSPAVKDTIPTPR